MDTYEATKTVMSRIQRLDPENASKIMGYILIQDQGEKEMIRLAFSPEALLLSYINQAKTGLGLVSSSPPSYPIRPNYPFPQRIMIPNNGFHLSNPSSPAQRSSPRPISYASVLDGSTNNGPGLHFYGGGNDFSEEFLSGGVHQDNNFPFLDDSGVDPIMSPSGRSDSLVFPYGEDVNSIPHPHPFHRRSCSVNDAAFLSNLEEGGNGNGFLWRPCMYFARGFCKNGSTCKFVHSDVGAGEPVDSGSPSKNGSGFDELLRMKAIQHHRLAVMASGGHHPFAHNKCMDENLRGDLSPLGLGGGPNSSSRQIYLTFPADSTFKEEDVSNYFSMFGPVQDVRIPYQQKRMFGFVTFVYPETVKLILAKGNPHFVCDSRVLVKPYKEKGKVREKKQQHQHLERGEYPTCLSPSGIDSREPFDFHFGSRMLLSPQDMMMRKRIEETELQHAIELQGRRMMNLQLMDMKNHNHNPHFLQSFPYSSPRQLMNQHSIATSDSINQEDSEELDGSQEAATSPPDEKLALEATKNDGGANQPKNVNSDDCNLPESLDHILPDNLFSSPTKLTTAENQSGFYQDVTNTSSNDAHVTSGSSPLAIPSLKSCYNFQMPRYSSVQEAAAEM